MMKFQLVSDLHFDFHKDHGKEFIEQLPVLSDILVMAGDICSYSLLDQVLTQVCSKFNRVIFVAGNHEYYRSDFQTVDDILRGLQIALSNFTWLENDRVVVDGQAFLGSTLWYEGSERARDRVNKRQLNDFAYIKNCDPEAFDRNSKSRKFLRYEVGPSDVVITHHMPSWSCITPKFQGSNRNMYFANNMDSVIYENGVKIWAFGHSHQAQDFSIHNTRLVCNPLAYPREAGESNFNESLVIEV